MESTAIEWQGRRYSVELYRPPGTGPWPAVLVLHELWGLNDDIRRIARRFAENGYLAAVPDLTGGRHFSCLVSTILQIRRGRGPAVQLGEALARLVRDRDDVSWVCAAGFCMGGGFALLLGTLGHLDATANYYGETRSREELAGCCPVTGGFGGRDRVFGPKGRKLVQDLEAVGVAHDVVVYDDCGHSYMNDRDTPLLGRVSNPVLRLGYHHANAEESWVRMLAFFAEARRTSATADV